MDIVESATANPKGKCALAFEIGLIPAVAPVIGRKSEPSFGSEVKWDSGETPLRDYVEAFFT
ncbi:MAG: hypothetical protein IJW58_03290 [Clostridia bacterium]|nr:hypothetical protein [Clostridia bacterium]